MLVSIAISTYEANGMGYKLLMYNLNQIFKQDYPEIEVVISDHSKDDKIKDVVSMFNQKNKYPIKYLRETENRGNISFNINNAIKHCSGDLIKIIFMDDYLYATNAISIIVDLFNKNKECKWLICSCAVINEKKELCVHKTRLNPALVFGYNTVGPPSVIAFRNINILFDNKLKWNMDVEFYHRIFFKYGKPIIYNETELIVNYHHDEQVTNTIIDDELKKKESEYINKKYENYINTISKYINKNGIL